MIDFKHLANKFSAPRQEKKAFFEAGKIAKPALFAFLFLGSAAADAKVIYVNGAIAKPGKGTSWKDAYKYLRDALDHSLPEDVIYVAKGTYYPDDGKSAVFGDREESFVLEGQKIYGGFAGTETSLNQRNPAANPTTLSGAIWNMGGEDVYWSLHVVVLNRSSTLSGFTIEDGHASGSDSWAYPGVPSYDEGGGCYVSAGATLTVSDCTFRNNRALAAGGAIMVEDDAGKVVATDCVFDDNEIPLIYDITLGSAAGGAIKGNVTATRCKFTRNKVKAINFIDGPSSKAVGGAIAGDVTAVDCEFTGNTVNAYITESDVDSTASGGAISGNVLAARCIFSGNQSTAVVDTGISSGGALSDGSIAATNCVFLDNESATGIIDPATGLGHGGGGAVHVSKKSTLANCIFVRNTSLFRGGAVNVETTSYSESLVVANCTFLDNGIATGYEGAALSCGGIVRMLNNIFWYGTAITGFTQDNLIHVIDMGVLRNSLVNYPTPSTVAPNIVKGGAAGIKDGFGGDIFLGPVASSIFSGDPLFTSVVDLDGADNKWGTADDGLRVKAGSPAIGISRDPRITEPGEFLPKDLVDIDGDGDAKELLPVDMRGVVRVQNKYVDMGAYELGNLTNVPEISVSVDGNTKVADGGFVSFGSVAKGKTLTKTFTISNTGRNALLINSFSVDGSTAFVVKKLVAGSIKPGGSMQFTVSFRSSGKGKEVATLHIANSDADEAMYDINLSATGVVKTATSKPLSLAAMTSSVLTPVPSSVESQHDAVVTTNIAADGSKYLVLTVRKSAGENIVASDVEVSSNLLDWFSGRNHTTTLVDTASVLSVRDNKPVNQGEKRYIRLH